MQKNLTKRKLNKVFYFVLIFFILFLTSCSSNNTNTETKECTSTTTSEYKEYMGVPEERIDYFSNVNIALILDTSGSMEDGDKLVKAKEASEWLVNELDERINIGLFEFNTNASILQDFTKDRNVVINAIKNIKARGSTYFVPVLRLAMLSFVKSYTNRLTNMIIFISDGQPKDSYREIIQKVGELTNNKICIYTVQYTSGDEDYAELKELEKILKEIAQISVEDTDCGRLYSDVGGQSSLVSVFKDIYTQIKSINYEAFFDVDISTNKFVRNQTITYNFNVESVYNLNKIPNEDKCILPVKILVHTYKLNGEEILNQGTATYDSESNKYNLIVPPLEPGKYYVTLDIEGDENFIKAYKRIDFEVYENDEFLLCPYTCEQYQTAIAKSLSRNKTIILNDGRCTLEQENYFDRYAELNFINKGNKTAFVTYTNKDEKYFSKFIKPNEEFSLRINSGNTDITCHHTVDEAILFSNKTTKHLFALDTASGMMGSKEEQMKELVKYIIQNSSNPTVFAFNDEIEVMEINKADVESKMKNLVFKGNTNILQLFNRINQTRDLLIKDNTLKLEKEELENETINFTKVITKDNVTIPIVPISELTIISDGVIYDDYTTSKEIENILNYAEGLINRGLCINAIVFGDDLLLRELVNISQANLNCGKITFKPESYFTTVHPKKISVNNYEEKGFNITARVFYDNSSFIFEDKTNLNVDIFVYENNYSSNEIMYDIICNPEIDVEVQLYRDSSMIFSKKATRITENNFFVDIENVPKNTYKMIVTANIIDDMSRKCDFSSKKEFPIDISNKLITKN